MSKRDELLTHAVKLAEVEHFLAVTRQAIADRAGVSPSLVQWYFRDLALMRTEIINAAIADRVLPVIAQALNLNREETRTLPQELREAAASYIVGG